VICLQDLVTTNLFYVAAKGSENLLSGIIIWDRSLSSVAVSWTYEVRYLANEGIFCLLPCHNFIPSDILLLLLLLLSSPPPPFYLFYFCEKLTTYGESLCVLNITSKFCTVFGFIVADLQFFTRSMCMFCDSSK
jgi:hypothetical protein